MTEPIACTLTRDDYAARAARIADLARGALVSRESLPRGARLRFTPGSDTEAELREIVATEARCCPFLEMEVRRSGGSLELDVTGPAEAEPLIAELFA